MPEEFRQEERRVPVVSDIIQDRMHRLQGVLLQITMEETKEGLEALMRDFAQGVVHQGLDDLKPEDPVLFLIGQRLCHRVCRSDLFCSDPSFQKKIKNNSDLLMHFNKKHDMTGTCCKDLKRHF
jgi:hypothetical protein